MHFFRWIIVIYKNISALIKTLDPCQGYGFFKGTEIPTPTLTLTDPTPDPCRFQNPWQSLCTDQRTFNKQYPQWSGLSSLGIGTGNPGVSSVATAKPISFEKIDIELQIKLLKFWKYLWT